MCLICDDVYGELSGKYGQELFSKRKLLAEEIHRGIGGRVVEGVLAR